MLKGIVDGIINMSLFASIAFLVWGNVMRFKWWIKQRKQKKSMGVQYYYLDFWGEGNYDYTDVEIENLHQTLQQFEQINKDRQ